MSGTQKASDFSEPVLQMAVTIMWVLGIELNSFGRAPSALSHESVAPDPRLTFKMLLEVIHITMAYHIFVIKISNNYK